MLTDAARTALVERLLRERKDVADEIPRRAASMVDLPQSFGQEQMWFLDRFAPGLAVYNLPHALRLSGQLDVAALGRALDALVKRHEVLRTRLAADSGGRPVQVIDPPQEHPLRVVDFASSESAERRARLGEFIDAKAGQPFALADDPLLRTWLVRLTETEHVLVMVAHHAVFDGWSAGLFGREVAALYQQEAGAGPSALPELAVQFADYAIWERERLTGPVLAELEGYWRKALAEAQTLRFPTDRPRPVLDSFDGGLADRMCPAELLEGLREVSRQAGTTLSVTLMAGLMAVLYRYTGQSDLVVGTVSANRGRSQLVPLIGYLVNTLPIRVDLSGDPPFTDLNARVREAIASAYAHQDLPFTKIVEALQVPRDPGRTPVFQIMLTYAERDLPTVRAAAVDFEMTYPRLHTNPAKFDLTITAEARPGGLWLECSYKTALFDLATVRRLLGHLEVLLAGVVADPSSRLSELPLMTSAELHHELVRWNDTAADVPLMCVHERFEAQVARAPDAVAAQFDEERLCYAELNRQANQIARRLRQLGVGPDALVGVCMTTGLPRLAALLGIWKAGGGYVPLDPALPANRLAFMITDTGMGVLLTDTDSASRLPASSSATTVNLDTERTRIAALDGSNLNGDAIASNIAYVIYTSGSTGEPKGVVVEHRQCLNFLHGMVENWQIGPSDVVLQFGAFTFDASVLDMFTPLLGGAKVVLASTETLRSPPRLATLIRDRHVTFALLPLAVLDLLADERLEDFRVLMTGGEELPSELASRWIRPGLRFVNAYGPTETTVAATYQELGTDLSPPPIGKANRPNYRAYVLDGFLNPVPVGVIGELHVGGAGVTRGYLNRPGLTCDRFIPDPFSTCPGARLYKTGDLVRRRPDGTLVFIGRVDSQVKIRGQRVEIGEIEAVLTAHHAIAQAVVTTIPGAAGDKQLAAYLRPADSATPDLDRIRAHLAAALPAYMIPAHLITVDAFPRAPSGKIDRAALPAPAPLPPANERATPATDTEAVIAGLCAVVLDRDYVGATDSFFDLGGSSLQVMRLVSLLDDKLGVDLGPAEVFLAPTPRQLSAIIDAARSGEGTSARSGPLVELSNGAGDLPLFLIHPVGGTVAAYAPLARELADTFKVIGMQAPALTRSGTTAASFTDLIDDYTQRIRAAQLTGPYRLAGWSMGGVVAFEIARRLEDTGARVALLALLDAPFATLDLSNTAEPKLAGQFIADAANSLGFEPVGAPDSATSTVEEQLTWLAGRLNEDEENGAGAVAGMLKRRFDVFQAHSRMLAGYAPAGPAVRAPTLIVSADHSPNAPARSRWHRVLRGPVATSRMDADHYTLLRPGLATDVATSILSWHASTESPATTARTAGDPHR